MRFASMTLVIHAHSLATRPGILLLVLRQAIGLILIGMAAGGAVAFAAARSIRSFLFGVGPDNPATFGVAAGVLCVIAIVAALLPAWRAVSIDPVEALRTE